MPNVLPMVVSKGTDQTFISTEYQMKDDTTVIRNYGNLLSQLSQVVPDGIVGFFPNFQ